MANAVGLKKGLAGIPADELETVAGVPPPSSALAALQVLSGMAAGAVMGAWAGPSGMIAGAVIGSAIGAAASIALDAQKIEELRHEQELDEEIGVIGGDIGAAQQGGPRAVRGTFSAETMGLGRDVEVPLADGPIPHANA